VTRRGGRPTLAGERATRLIRIRMTEQEARDLADIAKLNLKSRAAFMRDAINEAVADCRDRRVFQRQRPQRPAP
jgi:3-methyladenine DNA glycosylase AlkD